MDAALFIRPLTLGTRPEAALNRASRDRGLRSYVQPLFSFALQTTCYTEEAAAYVETRVGVTIEVGHKTLVFPFVAILTLSLTSFDSPTPTHSIWHQEHYS